MIRRQIQTCLGKMDGCLPMNRTRFALLHVSSYSWAIKPAIHFFPRACLDMSSAWQQQRQQQHQSHYVSRFLITSHPRIHDHPRAAGALIALILELTRSNARRARVAPTRRKTLSNSRQGTTTFEWKSSSGKYEIARAHPHFHFSALIPILGAEFVHLY